MKNSYIAESHIPFWRSFQAGEIYPVNNPQQTIPAPGTEYCFDIFIACHLLKIREPFYIVSGKRSLFLKGVFPDMEPETPVLKEVYGSFNFNIINSKCR